MKYKKKNRKNIIREQVCHELTVNNLCTKKHFSDTLFKYVVYQYF